MSEARKQLPYRISIDHNDPNNGSEHTMSVAVGAGVCVVTITRRMFGQEKTVEEITIPSDLAFSMARGIITIGAL